MPKKKADSFSSLTQGFIFEGMPAIPMRWDKRGNVIWEDLTEVSERSNKMRSYYRDRYGHRVYPDRSGHSIYLNRRVHSTLMALLDEIALAEGIPYKYAYELIAEMMTKEFETNIKTLALKHKSSQTYRKKA